MRRSGDLLKIVNLSVVVELKIKSIYKYNSLRQKE